MRLSFFPYFMFVCILSALCLTTGCAGRMEKSAKSEQSTNEKFDLFRPTFKSGDADKTKPLQDSERLRRLSDGLQRGFDPEKKDSNRAFYIFGVFLAGTGAVVVGLVYWQVWRRRQTEWELNDPMAIVKELNYVHQLSDSERRLMQEISNLHGLPTPLNLFVEPQYFLEALESDSYVSARSTIRRLLSKLFGMSVEVSTDASAADVETVVYGQSGIKILL